MGEEHAIVQLRRQKAVAAVAVEKIFGGLDIAQSHASASVYNGLPAFGSVGHRTSFLFGIKNHIVLSPPGQQAQTLEGFCIRLVLLYQPDEVRHVKSRFLSYHEHRV